MRPDEQARLQQFLGLLLSGEMDLGFAALPLITLYNKAKVEGVDFWQLLLTEPTIAERITKVMQQHAGKLPPSVITGLKLVIEAHANAKVQAKAQAGGFAKSAFTPGAVSDDDAP